jgi:uncharacterized protein YwlG (UPF0340 family)
MDLRFWTDPETGLPHISAHGVTEEEVRQVLSRPGLDFAEDRNARVHIGQTAAGRHLKVVYVPDKGSDSAFVVTAYQLGGKALKAYRRAKRRKRK